MIDLSNVQVATLVVAAVGGVIGALGVREKLHRDRLTRLIEQEEAELARRPAE